MSTAALAISLKEDSDKFDSELSEVTEDEDSGQERSEEEDDEYPEEEDTEQLLEQIERTFKNLLDQKITATETVYDHVGLGAGWRSQGHEKSTETPGPSTSRAQVLPPQPDSVNELFEALGALLLKAELAGKDGREENKVTTRSEGTQTTSPGELTSLLEREPLELPNEPEIDLLTRSTKAREEIANLRRLRDVLVEQRKETDEQIRKCSKSVSDEEPPEEEDSLNEKKLYEIEEAIEAIDSAIEMKNEIICGREFLPFHNSQSNEDDLIDRLRTLSLQELQRLFCKYFAKVVELRFSSKKLESQTEGLEANCDKMSQTMAWQNKQIDKIEKECETRIKTLIGLCNEDPNHPNKDLVNYVQSLEKKLMAAGKKQSDLERSLTELLVRHGYLYNGADYDVKTVVKMLGIDAKQMLNWKENVKESSRHSSRRLGISYHRTRRNSGVPGTSHRHHDRHKSPGPS